MFSSSCLFGQDQQNIGYNIGLTALHEDNIFNQSSAVGDNSLSLTPEVAALKYFGKHQLTAGYEGEYTAYADYDELNYILHTIGSEFIYDHSQRINLELGLTHQQNKESPGTTNASTNTLDDFVFYDQSGASATLKYGTSDSVGQIVGSYKYSQKRFDDSDQTYRDVNLNAFTAAFYYRVAPKTRTFLEVTLADYNYIDTSGASDQSSNNYLYLGGIEWDLANKTTGVFKLGYQDKNYDADYFSEITNLYYSLDMIWRPNTYSTVTLTAGRENQESALEGYSGYVSNFYSLELSHEFTHRLNVGIEYQYDTYEISDRTDNSHDLAINLTHSLSTWLEVSLAYDYQQRDSNYDEYAYTSNSVALSLQTKFE
ncbi:outer membrane beta-barrel protein [Reinekea marinisedimentorum]|nr:outer membrane beta-barrel protein [Reinekea marinisedimentorum]